MLECDLLTTRQHHHVGGATRISHPDYVVSSQYPPGLDKAKRRAIIIRRRAATLTVENGEVFVERRGRKVKVITTVADQNHFVNDVDL